MSRFGHWLTMFGLVVGAMHALASEVTAPTAIGFGDPELYEIRALRTSPVGEVPAWIEVEMGALRPITSTPSGLQQALVEVYLDDGGPGVQELLPGSGVRMPNGRGWRDAIRLSADGVLWWRAVPAPDGEEPPLRVGPVAIDFSREGNTLRFNLPHALQEGTRIVAISGAYHPFASSGWRPFAPTPTPWSFGGHPAWFPVVGLYPGGPKKLMELQRSGVLQVRSIGHLGDWQGASWSVLWIALGLAIFAVATLWRAWGSQRWWSAKPPLEASQLWLIGEGDVPEIEDEATGGSTATSAPSSESRSAKSS